MCNRATKNMFLQNFLRYSILCVLCWSPLVLSGSSDSTDLDSSSLYGVQYTDPEVERPSVPFHPNFPKLEDNREFLNRIWLPHPRLEKLLYSDVSGSPRSRRSAGEGSTPGDVVLTYTNPSRAAPPDWARSWKPTGRMVSQSTSNNTSATPTPDQQRALNIPFIQQLLRTKNQRKVKRGRKRTTAVPTTTTTESPSVEEHVPESNHFSAVTSRSPYRDANLTLSRRVASAFPATNKAKANTSRQVYYDDFDSGSSSDTDLVTPPNFTSPLLSFQMAVKRFLQSFSIQDMVNRIRNLLFVERHTLLEWLNLFVFPGGLLYVLVTKLGPGFLLHLAGALGMLLILGTLPQLPEDGNTYGIGLETITGAVDTDPGYTYI